MTRIYVTITDENGTVLESVTLEGPEGSVPSVFAAHVADHISGRFEEVDEHEEDES